MKKISTKGTVFIDEYGRERIFNGINVCNKNKYPSISREDIYFIPDFLAKRGINLIRLGINWAAIEKHQGVYDKEELENIRLFMDKCYQNDIYVFLDIHQDLYTEIKNGKFKPNGDGAPKWAAMTDGYKFPLPYFVWAQGYFMDKAVHKSFDHFWHNDKVYGIGLLDHFAKMWQKLAENFADHPAFFGFDFLNEPFPGSDGGKVFAKIVMSAVKTTLSSEIDKKKAINSLFKKNYFPNILGMYNSDILNKITSPANKYISDFDANLYMPFIDKMTKAVRAVTDNGIILIENSYYSNLGIPFSGRKANNGVKAEKNQAFAPHAYDFMVDTPAYKYADNNRVEGIFAQRRKEQLSNMDMPVIVGEWGGTNANMLTADFETPAPDRLRWLTHIEFLLDIFDKYKWSNCYWCYSYNTARTEIMDVLTRPYPLAVTGEIISYRHDRNNNAFELHFNQKENFDCETEIFAHKRIKSIETDGEYKIEALADGRAIVKIKTDTGEHKVKVNFVD